MRLPVVVERKLGIIKACGVEVSLVMDKDGIPYNIVIGHEVKTFDDSEKFYKFVDEKVKKYVQRKG